MFYLKDDTVKKLLDIDKCSPLRRSIKLTKNDVEELLYQRYWYGKVARYIYKNPKHIISIIDEYSNEYDDAIDNGYKTGELK